MPHKVSRLRSVTYRLPVELVEALDRRAAQTRVAISDIVREALAEKLSQALSVPTPFADEVRFVQIIERRYRSVEGYTYSYPVGLTRSGEVFEFDGSTWKRLSMEVDSGRDRA